jgi:hypothetical protein
MTLTRRQRFLDAGIWIFPGFNALYDTAFALMAAKDFVDEKYTDPAAKFTILGVSSVFSYAQSIKFNGQKTVDGIKEAFSIMATRKFPESWPTITHKQEIVALSLATIVTLSATIADYFGADYSVTEAPKDYDFDDKIDMRYWAILATFTGVVAGLTSTFTEGIGFYRILRGKFAGEEILYANRLSKMICYLLGYPISILGAAENMMEAYAAMKDRLSPGTLPQKYGVMIACSPKSVSDFYFAGKECRDAIDAFVGKVSEGVPTASEVAAFSLSSAAAYLVMMPQPYLTKDLINDPSTSLPFTSPTILTESLSYGVSLRDGIVQTRTLYPYFHQFTNAIDKKIRSGFNYVKSWCYAPQNADVHESLLTPEEQAAATNLAVDEVIVDIQTTDQPVYTTNHPNVLFKAASPKTPATPTPQNNTAKPTRPGGTMPGVT